MDKCILKNKISEFIKTLDLDVFGFIKCQRFDELENFFITHKEKGLITQFEEQDIEKRINPNIYMENGKTIISIAFPYMKKDNINEDEYYFSKYTKVLDYHLVVNKYLNLICEFIKTLGGDAIAFCDSNSLPERYIATKAGLGFVGLNNTFITKEYGSYVFLGEIITDIDLLDYKIEDNSIEKSTCLKCKKCITNCPTKALSQNCNDFTKCLSYITQLKQIEDKYIKKLDGRIFGCDICQDVCPHNAKIKYSKLTDFEVLEYMKELDILELIYMDNATFKEKYKNISAGWRGKSLIQRNAIIYAVLNNIEINDNKINSPYVKECYYKVLKLKEL